MTTLTTVGASWTRKFAPLFAIGAAGVASLAPSLARQLSVLPGVDQRAIPLLAGAALGQTALILAAAVAVGVALAPRLRLRSHLVAKAAEGTPLLPALRADLPSAVTAGVCGAALMLACDLLFRPWMGDSWTAMERAMPHTTLAVTLAGLLYGGITEELLMRWGVMTSLAWAGWRITQRGQGLPRPAIMWVAIVLAAIVFGVLHLPMTAMLTALTPIVIVRGLVINGIGGVIFGWLYWRRSLEAAMVAHAMFHVVATAVGLLLS